MLIQKNPKHVNIYLMVYLILYLCLSFGGNAFLPTKKLLFVTQFLPVFLGILYLILTGQPIFSSVRFRRFHPLTIPCIILFTYCIWPLLSLVNLLSMLFSHNMIQSTVNETVASGGLVPALISMAVIPAFVEEFTFRGIVYGQYRCQRPIKAILLSALCFGFMHMNLNQLCYAFVIGILLALVVEATGSILPGMIMHFTFNGTSIVLVYLQQMFAGGDSGMEELQNSNFTIQYLLDLLPTYLLFTSIGLVFAFFLFYAMARLNHQDKEIASWKSLRSYRKRPNIALTDISFYCFIIICLIFCIVIEALH